MPVSGGGAEEEAVAASADDARRAHALCIALVLQLQSLQMSAEPAPASHCSCCEHLLEQAFGRGVPFRNLCRVNSRKQLVPTSEQPGQLPIRCGHRAPWLRLASGDGYDGGSDSGKRALSSVSATTALLIDVMFLITRARRH